MRFCLYTFSLLLISIHLFSQSIDEKDFIHYGLRQGLSDNYVSGIAQDSNGYVWIATRRGLNRFDGKTFKQFLQTDKYNSIPDNSIYSMKMLNNYDLALATNDGAQIISTKTLEQLNLNIADDDKLRYWSNTCMYIMNDADGNYGVSTKTGFYIFSSSGQLKKRYDRFTRKDIGAWMTFGWKVFRLPDDNMLQLNQRGVLLYDRKKNLLSDASVKYPIFNVMKQNNLFFFISRSEIIHMNIETNSFDLVDLDKGTLTAFPSCVDLIHTIGWQSNPSKINDSTWAINGKSKGFFLLTINNLKKTVSCSPKLYFADKFCTMIFTDRNDNLWIGTNEGLYKQNSHPTFVETFALPGKVVSGLHILNDRIFVGTDKKEILVIDKYSKKLIRSVQLPVIPVLSNFIRTFHQVHPDTMWVGTTAGLYWLNLRNYSTGLIELNKGGSPSNIFLFFGDKKNNIWISNNEMSSIYYHDATKNSFVHIDSTAHPLFKTNIESFAEDKAGNIWIGGDAIVRWNATLQKIDTLIERLQTQRNFKKGYHVMADSKGDIWSTAGDDGLAKLTGNPMHLRPNNLTQEKSSFMLPALFRDKIYVYTAKGAGYFDIATLKSIAFTENDGIPPGMVSTSFFVEDATDGSVWFAINNSICKIPVHTSVSNIKPPLLDITALSILNDTILNYPSPKISLDHTQGDINIFYSAINYNDPENMQFFYRIKNMKDSSWIDAGDQQNILLTNISPGNYKIELKVAAYDNKWPEQIKEFEIRIRPPFWRTPLFYISVAIILATIAWLLYRYRIKQIKQKANIDKQLAQTEMKALHAQMNPHFIFNCLNSIREMILNNENEQASLYLSKFARLIRITLNHSAKQFVSLDDTIDYLHRYIEMESIRTNSFEYHIETDENLESDEVFLPPMLIQPFIENAIWHGALPGTRMHLWIRFKKHDQKLICEIEDDGIGIEASLKNKGHTATDQSVGISNARQRIDVLNEKYNLESSLDVKDKSSITGSTQTGTIVTLLLPIKFSLA
ncbi:MAG TPA: histidine kinase [Chitinophagaceae bacterium]